MSKKNTFKLAAYSSLAASFLLAINNGDGQAVYTDIEPNLHLSSAHDHGFLDIVDIDLDNNGVDDFTFLIFKNYFTTYILDWKFFAYGVNVGPSIEGHVEAIVGVSEITYGGWPLFLPYALEYDYLISSDLPFVNGAPQIMAGRHSVAHNNPYHVGVQVGFWYGDTADHYLGVRFQDEDDCLHYGWIRCAVVDSVRKLIIKDYAYETKCDVPIKAGDKVGDTTVSINTIHLSSAAIYSFNNTVFINLPLLNNTTALIHIYNITGQEIYTSTTKNNKTTIPLNVAAGIYLVEVISGENRVNKKVMIN